MSKIDDFKIFVKNNPLLVSYVKNGSNTWQGFYELYDLYGDDMEIWKEYLNVTSNEKKVSTKKGNNTLNGILEMTKSLDTDKLQDGLSSIQKAIDLFGGMITKDSGTTSGGYTPRPIYRKFDD